jgi:hypothetical protein
MTWAAILITSRFLFDRRHDLFGHSTGTVVDFDRLVHDACAAALVPFARVNAEKALMLWA